MFINILVVFSVFQFPVPKWKDAPPTPSPQRTYKQSASKSTETSLPVEIFLLICQLQNSSKTQLAQQILISFSTIPSGSTYSAMVNICVLNSFQNGKKFHFVLHEMAMKQGGESISGIARDLQG